MNNTINISQQNVTLASAQRAVADNINGYFAVVSFYAASTSGNRPNATGLTVQFDTRLKVIGAEEGEVFQQRIYNSEGLPVTSRGRSGEIILLNYAGTRTIPMAQPSLYEGHLGYVFELNVSSPESLTGTGKWFVEPIYAT